VEGEREEGGGVVEDEVRENVGHKVLRADDVQRPALEITE